MSSRKHRSCSDDFITILENFPKSITSLLAYNWSHDCTKLLFVIIGISFDNAHLRAIIHYYLRTHCFDKSIDKNPLFFLGHAASIGLNRYKDEQKRRSKQSTV